MKDNKQNNHDSAGDWDHDPNVEETENKNDWWNNEPNIWEPENDNIEGSEDNNDRDSNDIIQVKEDVTTRRKNHGMGTRRNRQSIVPGLPSTNNGSGLNIGYWMQSGSHICPTLAAMIVAEQAGIRMMKEYFKIEASK